MRFKSSRSLSIRLSFVATMISCATASKMGCVAKTSCTRFEDPACIANPSCTEGCDLCLKSTFRDGCTSITFCEWKEEDCQPCPSQTDIGSCQDMRFCEWMSECTAKSSCTWFQDSACVAKDICNIDGVLCGLCTTNSAQSVNVCAKMKECEWKDDCRQCTNLSQSNRDCVAEEFCEWKQWFAPRYPITRVDIVFVAMAIFFQLVTMCDLYMWVSVQVHSRSSMLV